MIASRLMSRSPVWLRKIPSTVSGSQGSRRGFPPAVRFAFPLGARLNITLRARPCQELFSESFCRPSRGPRGASRLRGLGPSRRRVRYYTLPRRGAVGKPSRTQDADNSSAVERRGRIEGGPFQKRGTAASGSTRLMRGQSPRRPSLVDSLSIYLCIDTVSNGCRRCAWSSSRNEATHPSRVTRPFIPRLSPQISTQVPSARSP